jgi:hypothetical protein
MKRGWGSGFVLAIGFLFDLGDVYIGAALARLAKQPD